MVTPEARVVAELLDLNQHQADILISEIRNMVLPGQLSLRHHGNDPDGRQERAFDRMLALADAVAERFRADEALSSLLSNSCLDVPPYQAPKNPAAEMAHRLVADQYYVPSGDYSFGKAEPGPCPRSTS